MTYPDLSAIQWILKPFERLTPEELYAVLRLRSRVFVLEQQCLYLDADDKDQQAFHLLGMQGNDLVACVRLFGPGDYYREAAIGRIVTAPEVRGKGLGTALLSKALEIVARLYGQGPVRIGAQQYLKAFYEGLGFVIDSDPYEEDGIPHVEMIYRPANRKSAS